MSKETGLSLIRAVLTLLGSYLIGKNIFGTTVDQNWLVVGIGAVITVASTVWGIISKEIGSEQLASALRSAVMAVGMIFVASGKLSSNALEQIALIVVTLIPIVLSRTSASTNKQLADPNSPITADPKSGKVIDPAKPKS